jgi:hypothetical protein
MKIRLILSLTIAVLFSVPALAQSVTVTPKKVTYKRPKPIQDYKKTFTVTYPKIKAATPALSKKIETAVSYEKVFPLDLKEEMNDVQWLEDASFEVKYNRKGALCLDLSIEGSGAYPDGSTKTVCVDTATGSRITPETSFTNLTAVAAMVKKAQNKEIAQTIAEIKKDPENNETDPKSLFESADFTAKDLDRFSIGDKGVTFHYDYGFPHVIQALQPAGEFFFSWTQLKPYIKPGSLLSRIAR